MAGIWVRAGTVTLTSGSKKVTGSGTAWNTGTNKVTKGCAFIYNNIDYEVDYVNSDTELYLVDTYGGTTGSGLSYRIQIAVTDTIPELASRIATALAYWNGQAANLQALTTGSGNVTLTAPDGTQVTVPSYSNMQPKDALLTALAALTTAADKLPYFTGVDTVAQTTLTAFARTLLDDIDAATARTTLGAQASDATLTALAAVVTAADKLIYATGADTFATATLTAFARTVLDDTDAATMLATLGVTKASTTETNARTATDRIVTPASLNAVVPYTPTVNPSLDLDFSKQKYRWYTGAAGLTESSTPSLMTFTRSTIATYFDAMGVMKQAVANQPRIDYDPSTGECKGLLIEESRTNLLTYSSRFDNAAWIKSYAFILPSTIVAPDGTLTVQKLIPDTTSTSGHSVNKIISATGVTYSIVAKAGEYSKLMLWFSGINSGYGFDLSSGTTFTVSGVASTGITASIVNIGNGFYRCSVYTASAITCCNACVLQSTTYAEYSGDGVSGLYVWGAQLEAGAFPTSYIPSTDTWTSRASTATYTDSNGVLQTAASGVARSATYDYDTDGVLRPIGLLLESSATNLVYPSTLTSGESGFTVTANYAASPDGTTNATRFVWSSFANAYAYASSITNTSGLAYTASVFLKPTSGSPVISLFMGRSDSNSKVMLSINLTTLACTATVSDSGTNKITGVNYSVKKAKNGFYRFSLTATHSEAMTTLTTGLVANSSSDSASGDILQYGLQLEVGNYATSYIQTTSAQATRVADTSTSAQATRAADNAVISGANFSQWFKQYEGTVVVEVNNQTTTSIDSSGYSRGCAVLSDGTDINRIRIGNDAGISFAIKKGGVDQTSQTVGVISVGRHKGALSFATNNINTTIDAVSAIQDVSASIPYLTQLLIGKSTVTTGLGGTWSSHIRTLKYYPKALSSTELQAMTA